MAHRIFLSCEEMNRHKKKQRAKFRTSPTALKILTSLTIISIRNHFYRQGNLCYTLQ